MFWESIKDKFRKKKEIKKAAEHKEAVPPVLNLTPKDVSPAAMRELLEKNLKWSQIIYEQNRRINSKFFWEMLFGWIKFALIAIPITVLLIFLSPKVLKLWTAYSNVIDALAEPAKINSNSIERIIKLLPLDAAKQEQIKQILK